MDRNDGVASRDRVEEVLEDLGAARSGLRVVDSTVMPSRLASTAVAIPIDDVPPRIRID